MGGRLGPLAAGLLVLALVAAASPATAHHEAGASVRCDDEGGQGVAASAALRPNEEKGTPEAEHEAGIPEIDDWHPGPDLWIPPPGQLEPEPGELHPFPDEWIPSPDDWIPDPTNWVPGVKDPSDPDAWVGAGSSVAEHAALYARSVASDVDPRDPENRPPSIVEACPYDDEGQAGPDGGQVWVVDGIYVTVRAQGSGDLVHTQAGSETLGVDVDSSQVP